VPITVARVKGNRLGFRKYDIERSDVVPLEDAVAYYTSALELNPTNTDLLGMRGIAWRALGEPEKAIENYTAAIRLNPTNATPLASRGRVYGYELDEFEKALADFDASLKLQPTNAHTLENRGDMLWRMGKIDDALECLDQAIRLDPNRCEAYGVRAQVWSAKGDRDKMRQDLDEGIHRHPEDRFAWSLRAWALATSPVAEHRDGPLAVAAATKACELTFWKDAHCLDILAAAHAEAGNFSEAVKRAEQAVSLTPKHKRAKYESRLALYHENKPYRETTEANK
jgi:tetratricopeptide (TPR) repeat protein